MIRKMTLRDVARFLRARGWVRFNASTWYRAGRNRVRLYSTAAAFMEEAEEMVAPKGGPKP